MKAKDIIPESTFTIYPHINVIEAYNQLVNLGIGHFPVVDRDDPNHILGIISDTDLMSFVAPDNYPKMLKHKKFQLTTQDDSFRVENYMTPVQNIKNFIELEEDHLSFIPKFYREDKPPFSLLLVVNNLQEKKLCGVISWVDLLANWEKLQPDDLNLTAKEVGSPIQDIPALIDGKYPVGLALLRQRQSKHRHLRILKEDILVALFHFHEISPYKPIREDIELEEYLYSLQLYNDIKPKFSVEERIVSADMPIWATNGMSVIKRFLDPLKQRWIWQDRIEALLIQQADGTITHLISPFDIIQHLVKKK